jgi:hypothetical protein
LQKQKGVFQHSSFLAGGATSAAGRLVVEDGHLKVPGQPVGCIITTLNLFSLNSEICPFQAVWPHSGHYRPTEQNFQEFMNFLKDRSVDLSDVKVRSIMQILYISC